MGKIRRVVYLVEGEDEEKILHALITDMKAICPGKIRKFNATQEHIRLNLAVLFGENATVVLVFDTDRESAEILRANIRFLQNRPNIREIICVPQVRKLEDELIRATSIRTISDLTKSKSNTDFKRDLIRMNHLADKLKSVNFDLNQFWALNPSAAFENIPNDSWKIKIKS